MKHEMLLLFLPLLLFFTFPFLFPEYDTHSTSGMRLLWSERVATLYRNVIRRRRRSFGSPRITKFFFALVFISAQNTREMGWRKNIDADRLFGGRTLLLLHIESLHKSKGKILNCFSQPVCSNLSFLKTWPI